MLSVPPEPFPTRARLEDSLRALGGRVGHAVRPDDLDARDPAFIARVLPLLGALSDYYFRAETELEVPLPEGPALFVGNHNGGVSAPDMFCHMVAFFRLRGIERPAYGMMHQVPFRLPAIGAWMNGIGALRAHPDNARAAFDRGAQVLVFPGGDVDACKPHTSRYRVELAGRKGFIRLALRAGVPIVPIVSVGAHESFFVLTDGARLARFLHFPALLRTKVFPLGLALPFGLWLGPVPHLPLPAKIHTRILAPLELDHPPSAADDEAVVDAVYARVVDTMQRTLDELARAGRHGLFPRHE